VSFLKPRFHLRKGAKAQKKSFGSKGNWGGPLGTSPSKKKGYGSKEKKRETLLLLGMPFVRWDKPLIGVDIEK